MLRVVSLLLAVAACADKPVIGEHLREVERIADEICRCTEWKCVEDLGAKMEALGQPPRRPNKLEIDRAAAIGARMKECQTKLEREIRASDLETRGLYCSGINCFTGRSECEAKRGERGNIGPTCRRVLPYCFTYDKDGATMLACERSLESCKGLAWLHALTPTRPCQAEPTLTDGSEQPSTNVWFVNGKSDDVWCSDEAMCAGTRADCERMRAQRTEATGQCDVAAMWCYRLDRTTRACATTNLGCEESRIEAVNKANRDGSDYRAMTGCIATQ